MTPTIESSMEVERDEFAFSREDVETYELTEEERDGPSFATEAEAAEYYQPFIAHACTHLRSIFPQLPTYFAVYPLLQSFQRQFSQDRGITVQSIQGNPKDLGIVCVPDAQHQHYEKVMFGNKRESPAFATSKAILALAMMGEPYLDAARADRYLLEILSYFIVGDLDHSHFTAFLTSLVTGNTHEARRNLVLLMEKYSVDVLSLDEFRTAFQSLFARAFENSIPVFTNPNGLELRMDEQCFKFIADDNNITYAYKYYVLRKKGRATKDRMQRIAEQQTVLHNAAVALSSSVQRLGLNAVTEVTNAPFSPITIEEVLGYKITEEELNGKSFANKSNAFRFHYDNFLSLKNILWGLQKRVQDQRVLETIKIVLSKIDSIGTLLFVGGEGKIRTDANVQQFMVGSANDSHTNKYLMKPVYGLGPCSRSYSIALLIGAVLVAGQSNREHDVGRNCAEFLFRFLAKNDWYDESSNPAPTLSHIQALLQEPSSIEQLDALYRYQHNSFPDEQVVNISDYVMRCKATLKNLCHEPFAYPSDAFWEQAYSYYLIRKKREATLSGNTTNEEVVEKLPTVQEVQQVFEDAFREAEALPNIHPLHSKSVIDGILGRGRVFSKRLLTEITTDTLTFGELDRIIGEIQFFIGAEFFLSIINLPTGIANDILRADCGKIGSVLQKSFIKYRHIFPIQEYDDRPDVGAIRNIINEMKKEQDANKARLVHDYVISISEPCMRIVHTLFSYLINKRSSLCEIFFQSFLQLFASEFILEKHPYPFPSPRNEAREKTILDLTKKLFYFLITEVQRIHFYDLNEKAGFTFEEIKKRATAIWQEVLDNHLQRIQQHNTDDAVPIPYGLAMQQLDEAKLEDVTRAMILGAMQEQAKEVGITFTKAGKFFGTQEGITAIPERMCSQERDLFSLCLHVYIEQHIARLATQKMREKDGSVDFCTISTCLIVCTIAKKFGIKTEGVHWDEVLASIASIKTLCGVSEPPTQNNEATLISHERIHQLAQESATKTFFQTKPYVIAKELSEEILQRINAMIDFGLQTLREIHKGDHYSFLDVFEILNHIFYSSVLYISGDAELLMKNPVTFQSWNNVYKRFVVTFLEKIRDYFEQLKQDIIKQETLAIDASFLALPSDITDRLQHSPLADTKVFRTVTDPLRSHKNNGLADNAPERTVHNEAFRQFRDGASAWNAMSNPPRFCFPVCTPDTFQLFLKAVAYGISMVKNTEIQEELRALWIEWVRHYGTPTANDDTQDSSTSTSNDHSQEQEVSTDDNNASSSNTQAETTPQDPLLECLEALGVDESRVQERVLQYCTDRLDQSAANLLASSLSTTNAHDAMTLELQSFLQHATELLQEAIATCVQTSGTMTHTVMQNVVANVSASIASSAPTGGTHFSSSSLVSVVLRVIEELMPCKSAEDYLELFDTSPPPTPSFEPSAHETSVSYPRLEAVKNTAKRRAKEAQERTTTAHRQRLMREVAPAHVQETRRSIQSLLQLLTDLEERLNEGDESAAHDLAHVHAAILMTENLLQRGLQ